MARNSSKLSLRSSTSVSRSCGSDCWVKAAWRAPYRATSLHAYQEHSPAKKEAMEELTRQIHVPIRAWQTRLLKILPNPSDDGLIECELLAATLGDKVGAGLERSGEWIQFNALSYSWGWPEFTVSIKCNGIMFPVTRHLAEALRHFRYPDRERYLWTDAICINQYDPEEKGLQVQSMYKIFKQAESVLGWLGPPTGTSYQLLNCLSTVAEWNLQHKEIARGNSALLFRNHDRKCQRLLDLLQDAMLSLVSTNPWFSRTWIRQELAAARSVEMYAGFYHFPIEVLAEVAEVFEQTVYPRTFLALLRAREPLNWFQAFFTNAEGFKASLDHDRVYALQNIVEGSLEAKDRLFPVIAYDKSPVEVYETLVKRLMESQGFGMLNVFEDYSHRSQDAGLPSWVPDPRINQIRFVGSRLSPWSVRAKQDLGEAGVLRLHGFIIGSIGARLAPPNWENEDEESGSIFNKTYSSSKPDSSLTQDYNSSESRFKHIQTYGSSKFDDHSHSRSWTEQAFFQALEEVSYSYYSVDFHAHALRCENPRKHEERLMATSAGQPGDIVVCFRESSFVDHHYLLRKVKHRPSRYKFLGPCIFQNKTIVVLQKFPFNRQSFPSKTNWLMDRVKNRFHFGCWKHESQMDHRRFAII